MVSTEQNYRKALQVNRRQGMRIWNRNMTVENKMGTLQRQMDKQYLPIHIVGNVFLLGLLVLANEILDTMASRTLDSLVDFCLKGNFEQQVFGESEPEILSVE